MTHKPFFDSSQYSPPSITTHKGSDSLARGDGGGDGDGGCAGDGGGGGGGGEGGGRGVVEGGEQEWLPQL